MTYQNALNNEIAQTIANIQAHRNALIDALRKQAKELNATEDAQGRFHAPSGGCFFDGTFYVGGEYLPFSYSGSLPKTHNGKALIEFNDFNMFKVWLKDYSDISHGKTWERDGKTFCYIYFNGIQPSKMTMAIEKYYADKAPKKEEKIIGESPSGKMEIIGKVLGFKEIESYYGYSLKMLVELDNGSKVFGTAPKGEYGQGDKIAFKADFSVKEHGFSFFKRPKFIRVV